MKQTRNTSQRRLIRELLEQNQSHLTADEIYELARKKSPNISRATVYRNLNLLAENGEIVRLAMPLGPDHYDCGPRDHYHFLCRSCHRVLDTSLPYDAALNLESPQFSGCKTEWHWLVLVGLCPDCGGESP